MNIQQLYEEIEKTKKRIDSLDTMIEDLTDGKGFDDVRLKFGCDKLFSQPDEVKLTTRTTKRIPIVGTRIHSHNHVEFTESSHSTTVVYKVNHANKVLCEELKKVFTTAKENEEESLERLKNQLKCRVNEV